MSASSDFSWLREHLLPYVKPVILGSNQFFKLIASIPGHMREITYGDTINWTLIYADNDSIAAGDEGESLGTAGKSYYAEMEMAPQIYRGYYSIKDETRVYENSPMKFTSTLQEEKRSCLRALTKQVNTDTYSGTGTSGIFGLAELIKDSGTYAAQTRGTSAWHTPYYNDNSGSLRSLTAALLDDVYFTQYNRMTDEDDDNRIVILCSPSMLIQFDSLSTIAENHVMNLGSATRQIGASVYNYTYRNHPIIPIRSNAATHPLKNKILMLNLNDFYVNFLRYIATPNELEGYGMEFLAVDDATGVLLKKVPSDKDEDLYMIKTAIQITNENMYRVASLVDITE